MREMRKWLLRVALALAIYWASSYVIELLCLALFKVPLMDLAIRTPVLVVDILCSWLIGGELTKRIFGE